MRTLSCNLTTEQKADSVTPYVKLTFRSRDGATERTFATDDCTNKIVAVYQAEARDFENSIVTTEGQFSTVIRLRDTDNSLGVLDWEGYAVFIDWGFDISCTPESSISSPGFVFSVRRSSTPQDIYIELLCISLWQLSEFVYLNKVTGGGAIHYEGNARVSHILMDLLAGVAPDAVFQDDGGAFTDFTSESADYTTGNIDIYPSTPASGDIFYIGSEVLFNRITFDISTPGSGLTIAKEYFDGCNWVSLDTTDEEYRDGTSDFTNTGVKLFSFSTPSDWAQSAINCETQFWIRFRLTAASCPDQPVASRVFVGMRLGLEQEEIITGFTLQPTFETEYRLPSSVIAQKVLQFTLGGIRMKLWGFFIKEIDNSETCEDYTYEAVGCDTEQIIYQGAAHATTVLPNHIIITDLPLDDVTATEGGAVTSDDSEGKDSDSISAWGLIPSIVEDASAVDTSTANALANRRIAQMARDKSQGYIYARMNVGQEVWDWVRLEDSRLSHNFEGRVARIVRTWTPGLYAIEVELGNFIGSSMTNLDDLFRSVAGILPNMPLPPIPFLPTLLDMMGRTFSQARQTLRQESVGGLFDLGPDPSSEALAARLQFQIASFVGGRIASMLPSFGEAGIDVLRGISGTDAGIAAAFGLSGVAPQVTTQEQREAIFGQRAFTGEATPGAISAQLVTGLRMGQPVRRNLTLQQIRFLQRHRPGEVGVQEFQRIGRVSPNIPISPSLVGQGFGGVPAQIAPTFVPVIRPATLQSLGLPGPGEPGGFGSFLPAPTVSVNIRESEGASVGELNTLDPDTIV